MSMNAFTFIFSDTKINKYLQIVKVRQTKSQMNFSLSCQHAQTTPLMTTL